jgi:hypothetical protein
MGPMTEDSMDPTLDRLERTVRRFGDEAGWRLAVDFGELSRGELTWSDMRRVNWLVRAMRRLDDGGVFGRLEAEWRQRVEDRRREIEEEKAAANASRDEEPPHPQLGWLREHEDDWSRQ